MKPELICKRGVVAAGGLPELAFVVPLLLPLLLLLLLLGLLLQFIALPLTWSTDLRCVRNFSSRRHLARRLENQTWKYWILITFNMIPLKNYLYSCLRQSNLFRESLSCKYIRIMCAFKLYNQNQIKIF